MLKIVGSANLKTFLHERLLYGFVVYGVSFFMPIIRQRIIDYGNFQTDYAKVDAV